MGDQGDRALMLAGIGVPVNQFMQRRTSRHRIQQQYNTRQQGGDDRLAGQFEMALSLRQTACNIAALSAAASDNLHLSTRARAVPKMK